MFDGEIVDVADRAAYGTLKSVMEHATTRDDGSLTYSYKSYWRIIKMLEGDDCPLRMLCDACDATDVDIGDALERAEFHRMTFKELHAEISNALEFLKYEFDRDVMSGAPISNIVQKRFDRYLKFDEDELPNIGMDMYHIHPSCTMKLEELATYFDDEYVDKLLAYYLANPTIKLAYSNEMYTHELGEIQTRNRANTVVIIDKLIRANIDPVKLNAKLIERMEQTMHNVRVALEQGNVPNLQQMQMTECDEVEMLKQCYYDALEQ